ncbi:MAG: hypothetical protein ACAI35_03780 [Candidatus Methylacidiphilales bacterium]|nr:hypothetical protein [Candidatus Methylacidiphilales bacterium]
MKPYSRTGKAAFSLVEIVISLAIVSTILVPVICLIALAVSNTQDESFKTGAGCILSLITSDVRSASKNAASTALYKIQLPTAGATTSASPIQLYVDADYNITPSVDNARYQIHYWTTGSTTGRQESSVRVVISWPAKAQYANALGSLETIILFNRSL